MILNDVDVVGRVTVADAWTIISGFQNTRFVSDLLENRHKLGHKGRGNIAKQAEQIRYCLIQAAEYFKAAEAVSIATRPLLLYYGIMSLAIAEFMFKQDGMSSLDKAREGHAHHGLDLRVKSNPSKAPELSLALDALVAAPAITPARGRYGTFELWHRSAREWPISGVVNFQHPEGGGGKTAIRVILEPNDSRLPLLPEAGLSLRYCFSHLPWLSRETVSRNLEAKFVRAKFKKDVYSNADSSVEFILQPTRKETLDAVCEKIKMHPSAINFLTGTDFGDGGVFRLTTPANNPSVEYVFPIALQKKVGEVFLLSEDYLNEFGIFYLGMYILGNYARYYPDHWMRDVESSSDLALVSKEFLDCAVDRVPYLLASELLSKQLMFD